MAQRSSSGSHLAGERLGRSFYERPVLTVARECLGMWLVHETEEGIAAGRIVEAEAYRGPEDLAAHSAGGRRTKRTEAMFGQAGHAYMFLLYGMHWAFNLVVAKEGEPHAVLIRAVEPVLGAELMAARRGLPSDSRNLANGPGKLCQALALDRNQYGQDLCSGRLYLAKAPRVPDSEVLTSPRINVDYAKEWAALPWRFFVGGNRFVSGKLVKSPVDGR